MLDIYFHRKLTIQTHNMVQTILHNENKGCKDQESIQSSTTPDPGYQWESDKLTVRHHKREPRGQHKAKQVDENMGHTHQHCIAMVKATKEIIK